MLTADDLTKLLADIADKRAALDDLEQAMHRLYVLPGGPEMPADAETTEPPRRPPAAVIPVTVRVAATRRAKAPRAAGEKTAPTGGESTSQYAPGILRALKSEQGQHGLTCGDITRTITGPGKPAEITRVTPLVWSVLKTMEKRGQVRKDGRFYYIVRAHEAGEA